MIEGAEHHDITRDGVTLAVAEAGPRSGPAVVLVHGYPDTKEMWRPVFERLADAFHVVAYDVRGAGRSSAPRGPSAYSFDDLSADFEAVCEALAPGRRVHLVGHDWGGIQGWEFATAAHLDGRLASFTSIAGPAIGHVGQAMREPLRRGHVVTSFRRMRRSWYIAPLLAPGGPTVAWTLVLRGQRWRQVLQTAEHLATDDDYPSATVAADGRHGANLYRRNIPSRIVRRAEPAPARVPVQLIVPSGDRFISPSITTPPSRSPRGCAGARWPARIGCRGRIPSW